MFSLIKTLITYMGSDSHKETLRDKLNKELEYLNDDTDDTDDKTKSAQPADESSKQVVSNGAVEKTNCFINTGVITNVSSNHGIINHHIFFELSCVSAIAGELHIGDKVEYLAYQKPNSDHLQIIKIVEVVEKYWDEDVLTEKKIDEKIEELKSEQPHFFTTHSRSIFGCVLKRSPNSITIDTDNKPTVIELDDVSMDVVPQVGDNVIVLCDVQSDENFVDKQGEILAIKSVHPARRLTQECTVTEMHKDYGVLDADKYFTFDIIPGSANLTIGDNLKADLVECSKGDFVWRCCSYTIVQKQTSPIKNVNVSAKSPTNGNGKTQAVSVTDDVRCVLSALDQEKSVELTITNHLKRTLKVKSIEWQNKRSDMQLTTVDPKPHTGFELKKGESYVVRILAKGTRFGETRESLHIYFDTFNIRRVVTLCVCDGEEAAEKAANLHSNSFNGGSRQSTSRARMYAQHVWNKKSDVIVGVGTTAKRRFISHRLSQFEVPERLRTAYLTSATRSEVHDELVSKVPCLGEELNMRNYTLRMHALLHLEEIENYINFRKFDQERAHFTRDGEYLSLTIEDLAERCPSLVLGDIVRATNPWHEDEKGINFSYDGIIHKVLHNRILLKFNGAFQSKYNGEDYSLQFYFSRFGYRKMHHSVNTVVNRLGEEFLFSSRVTMRPHLQLDISIDENHDMYQQDSKCEWFNPCLNSFQKMAIYNVLRGEANLMPYIIFGPPGTGKTLTLVETILQLTKRLPSARLLVATPSNSAADLIATRLIESNVLHPGDFARLVSQNLIEKELIPDHLKPYSITIDIGIEGTCEDSMITTNSGLKLKCSTKHLGGHRITISTCSTIGNFLQMGFSADHFTHVLIDEAAQCTEPEIMVPICQVSKTRGQVVLAGDPNQLQAVVMNTYARDTGLARSFLDRILSQSPYTRDILRFPKTCGYDPRVLTKLCYNYRSLPSVLHAYNSLFYHSELLPVVKEEDSKEALLLQQVQKALPESATRKKSHGVFFVGLRSENLQEPDSPSWFNPVECKSVFLMTIHLYQADISPERIGIITPYARQVKHLRNTFTSAKICMPKIGTVEEFQGQERDIILISTVRSGKQYIIKDLSYALGFVRCPRRMNVAISRARSLLIIFGNPHLLVLDPCWAKLIRYCVESDGYSGCDLPAELTQPVEPLAPENQNEESDEDDSEIEHEW